MKRRIFGVENEYALIITPPTSPLECDLACRRLFGSLPYAIPLSSIMRGWLVRDMIPSAWSTNRDPLDGYSGRSETNDMLVCQARAYFDSPNAEYATQECDDIFDLIACEKAGESYFGEALLGVREGMQELGYRSTIRLFKNNRAYLAAKSDVTRSCLDGSLVDERSRYEDKFVSYGTHENYLINSNATDDRLCNFFIPHLIALTLFSGGGCIEFNVKKNSFEFSRSQRFPWMGIRVGVTTKGTRSFIVFRFTEIYASKEYRRMQVICNDATLSESSLLLKYATSAMMLEMIEDKAFYNGVIKNMIEKQFAWAATDKSACAVAMAATTNALDDPLPTPGYRWTLRSLAAFFAELRERYAEHSCPSEDRRAGLALERSLLSKLNAARDTDDSVILAPYADHAFMKQVVEHDMKRFGYSYETAPEKTFDVPSSDGKTVRMSVSRRLRFLEAVCHEIDPGKSRFELAQIKGLIPRVVTPERIEAMKSGPPKTTRANRRKAIADRLRAEDRLYRCTWAVITAKNPDASWDLEDPFISEATEDDIKKISHRPLFPAD